jgi:HAD superfamily hydrolase (TIGR01509 family)
MKKYKAIFFDRDGTLTYGDPRIKEQTKELVKKWGGLYHDIEYEEMMGLFDQASEGRRPWYKDVEDEIEFFKRYNKHRLQKYGIHEDLDEKADMLHEISWLKSKRVYPEVIEVLEYFKSKGYKMGVISDTSPSLELTLKACGIAKYFTSFTASSLLGAMKPDPVIFNAALSAQGVAATESLYVDDYDAEADGARELGFTSFLIDRESNSAGKWTIKNLREIIDFAESV